MRYLVCFDVSSGRRRNALVKLCLEHGFRVQKSVFEMTMEKEILNAFESSATRVVDCKTDSVRIYPMDQAAEKGLRIVGQGCRHDNCSCMIL